MHAVYLKLGGMLIPHLLEQMLIMWNMFIIFVEIITNRHITLDFIQLLCYITDLNVVCEGCDSYSRDQSCWNFNNCKGDTWS